MFLINQNEILNVRKNIKINDKKLKILLQIREYNQKF